MQVSTFFDWQYSEEFKKTATDFANALWDILSHAEHYSFAEDPLPVFYLLHAAYCDYDVDVEEDCINFCSLKPSNLTFNANSERHKLLELFPKDCATSLYSDWEVLTEFCMMLSISRSDEYGYDFQYEFRGAKYKYIHPFIIDFFINKLIQLYNIDYEFSEICIEKIWNILLYKETGNSSDYYIPYSGLASIALFDINNSYSCERVNYYCEEDNSIFSIISKVRLCAYGHNYNIVKTSSEINNEGFSFDRYGETTMVSIPPFNRMIKTVDGEGKIKLINIADDIITKYLNDSRIKTAYFVFPINFAKDSKLKDIRKKLVEGKLIKSIDLIPEGSFMSSSTSGILLCLDKGNELDSIKFVYEEDKYNDVSYNEIINNDFLLNPDQYRGEVKADETISSLAAERCNALKEKVELLLNDPNIEEVSQDNRTNSVSSDLMHCLGPVFNRINSLIDGDLCEEENIETAKRLKDNISYMSRIIKSFGADFSSYMANKKEIGVNDFFQEYYSSLQNCNRSVFKVEYSSRISDDTTFDVDVDLMRIMLDTILDNAYRHGFNKTRNIDARVGIYTSSVVLSQKRYVLIEVANNGTPFPADFTLEKFIARGEFCGQNGRTGLGGNHVYNIVKKHDGYINIAKSAKWSVIFQVLIPIEYFDVDFDICNTMIYGNTTKCL